MDLDLQPVADNGLDLQPLPDLDLQALPGSQQPVLQAYNARKRATAENAENGVIPTAFRWAQSPLINVPPAERMRENLRSMSNAELVSPGYDTDAAETPLLPPGKVSNVITGTEKELAALPDFFTSPLGIATLGSGALPKIAQRTIAAAFATQMASQTPEIASELGAELGKPEDKRDYTKIGQLATRALVTTGFTAMGAHDAVAPEAAVGETAEPEPAAAAAPAPLDLQPVSESPVQSEEAEGAPAEQPAAAAIAEPETLDLQPIDPTNDTQIISGEAEPEEVTNKAVETLAKPTNSTQIQRLRYTIRPNGKFDIAAQSSDEGTFGLENNLTYDQLVSKVGNPIADLIKNHLGDSPTNDSGWKDGVLDFTDPRKLEGKLRSIATEPAKPVTPTERPEEGVPLQTFERPPDILDDLEAHTGGVKIPEEADFDYVRTAFKELSQSKAADLSGAKLKSLFRGSDPDLAIDALHREGLWRNVTTPDELFQKMIGAAKNRVDWAAQERSAARFKPNVQSPTSTVEAPDWAVPEVGPNDYVGMGGATPAEFLNRPGIPTGIKNAAVDAERVARGLPPAMEPARRSFGDVWDQANRMLDDDPHATDKLVNELREKPRAVTDTEDALLLQHQIALQNEHSRVTRELAQATDDAKQFPNRLDDAADLKLRQAKLSDDLLDVYNINKSVGTETSRGLAARRMMAYEDFSLAKMELDRRAANGGRQLSDAERAEVQQLHDRIAATQKQYDDYVAKTEAERAQRQASEEINDMIQRAALTPGHDKGILSLADRIVGALEKEADKARQRLKTKFARTSAGVDPTILGDLAVVGAAKIARGALDFTRWSKEMVTDFGEDVVPWLNQAWTKSNERLDESVNRVAKGKTAIAVKRAVRKEDVTGQRESIVEGLRQQKGQPLNALGPYVRKLAENFVRSGIKDRGALIDAVHGVLTQEIDPNITKRQAMDAISGYGDFKPLDQDAVKVQLRELKGQMQQVAKLEDIQAKKPLQKTGLERRVPSDEERRLIQQVNEAKRRYGVVTTDPARQLSSALDAIKTRLRNQIKDLDFQIATKEKIVRSKTPVTFDAEATRLQLERNQLKAKYDEIFAKPGLTDAQRVQNALRTVKASMDEYQRRIDAKDISKPGSKTPETPELATARAQRDALRGQFEELRDANEGYQREQAANDLQRQKTALETSIAQKEAQLKAGAGERPGQPVNRPADPLLEQLMQRRDALTRQMNEARKVSPADRYARDQAKRLEDLQQRIAERQAQLSTGDISPSPKQFNRPLSPQLEMAKQQLELLNRQLSELRNPPQTAEQRSLAALKTRLQNRTADLQDRLARQDFTTRPRRTVTPDAEALRLKVEMEKAKQAFQRALLTDRLKNRPWSVKAQDAFLRWRRGFLLSSPVTLAKLTSAAAQRLLITPIEEGIGGAISKVLPGPADRAPREGGLNVNAEAKAMTEAFMQGFKDSRDVLKEGKSQLEVLYGKGRDGAIGESDVQTKSVIDIFGQLHAALKAPVKRAEFARSFEKRMAWNMRQGIDVRDPAVQTRISVEAYKDANRSIFLQDNRVVSAYKRALTAFEQPNKTGKVPIGGKLASTTARALLPIVRVPTNLVAETFQYALGSVSGSTRLAFAMRRGIETLSPDEADLIMRHLKKGSLGGALLLAGYFLPNAVGGYYQPGQKRDKSDVPIGGLRIAGVTVPTYLLHNPLLETLQLGATIRRVADSKLRKKDEAPQGITAGLQAGALGLTEQVPFVREMGEVTKAFDPHSRGAFVGELTKSLAVPQLLQFLAQHQDQDATGEPVQRKPTNTLQHVETGIPFLRQNVPQAPLPANPAVTRAMQSIRGGTPQMRESVRQAILWSMKTNAPPAASNRK